jgi:hypothetical protein
MSPGSSYMNSIRLGVLAVAAAFVLTPAHADDPCVDVRQGANEVAARARAAEAAGDLKKALKMVQANEVRGCSDDGEAMIKRLTQRLGREAEAAGRNREAVDYYRQGSHDADAGRAGLAQLQLTPADRSWADQMMTFMRGTENAAGIATIRQHASTQAQRLLAQEEKTFAIRTPHEELLEEARGWLHTAGDDDAAVRQRALARADQFAALDYHYALEQALGYYETAGRSDRQAAVKSKARKIADGLADGDNWAAAAELYDLAGESGRAEALRAKREASAASNEEARKSQFQKDQDKLEKELDL